MNKKAYKKLNPKKEAYLDRVTDQTSYPVLRGLTSVLSYLMLAVAGVNLGLGVLLAIKYSNDSLLIAGVILVITLLSSGVIYILGRLFYEVASIFADIADSILDLNCRYDQQ
jgi:hypothetical protein